MQERKPDRPVRGRRAVLVGVIAAAILAATALAASGAFAPANDNAWPYEDSLNPPVLATVGDVACQPSQPIEGEKQKDVCDRTGTGNTERMAAQTATADEIEAIKPNLVAILGDEQYQVGRYEDFMGCVGLPNTLLYQYADHY